MNTPSTSKNTQPPTAPQPPTEKEALPELDLLDIRITRLEAVIDLCVEDITECRSRIVGLQHERKALMKFLLPSLMAGAPDAETVNQAPPVSLRETIRRSVCAEPGDYKTVAERLNVKPKQASAQLSRLHHRGAIGKSGSIYGPPDYCDKTVSGRA
jgi:hypothetical protein